MKIDIKDYKIIKIINRIAFKVVDVNLENETINVWYALLEITPEKKATDTEPAIPEKENEVEVGNRTLPLGALSMIAGKFQDKEGINQLLAQFLDSEDKGMELDKVAVSV